MVSPVSAVEPVVFFVSGDHCQVLGIRMQVRCATMQGTTQSTTQLEYGLPVTTFVRMAAATAAGSAGKWLQVKIDSVAECLA